MSLIIQSRLSMLSVERWWMFILCTNGQCTTSVSEFHVRLSNAGNVVSHLHSSATSSVCQFLFFSGISCSLCITPIKLQHVCIYSTCRTTILWSIIEYLTFWEAWSNPSYSTVCLHLYSNCFRSNCVQNNNIDHLTIECSCSCATNI